MSLFITFEGGEGCGKSTQSRMLHQRLTKLALPVMLIHEPGGTRLGTRISYLLKWAKDVSISPVAELLLFNASRAHLVDTVIKPAMGEGKFVICDRFTDSTLAYQGYGRGLELELVRSVCDIGARGLKPDLTIFLDVPVEEGLQRKHRMGNQDRFEQIDVAFHQRIRQGYLTMVQAEPQRWLVIDGTQSKDRIREIIWQHVSRLLTVNR
jgi:dTMP kinase